MKSGGISPIIATILLVAITVIAATPVVVWLAGYYTPSRKFVDLAVYAGHINENIVRFHIQHMGGETIKFDPELPTTAEIRGYAKKPGTIEENRLYCWTFENPLKFRQSDWAYAEVQIRGAEFEVGGNISVRIVSTKAGLLHDGEVVINSMSKIPGG